MPLRVSLAGLMKIVGLVAALAATAAFVVTLRGYATQAMAAGFFIVASIAAGRSDGPIRAFYLGFAIAGLLYFAAAFATNQGIFALPTARPLARLYDWAWGPPVIKTPDDIVPFIARLQRYIRAAHSIVALLVGLGAGSLAAGAVAVRQAWRRVSSRKQVDRTDLSRADVT